MISSLIFYLLILAYWLGVSDRRQSNLAWSTNPSLADKEVKGLASKSRKVLMRSAMLILSFVPLIVSAANYYGIQIPGDLPWLRDDVTVQIGAVRCDLEAPRLY
jgi:hypothetical protein